MGDSSMSARTRAGRTKRRSPGRLPGTATARPAYSTERAACGEGSAEAARAATPKRHRGHHLTHPAHLLLGHRGHRADRGRDRRNLHTRQPGPDTAHRARRRARLPCRARAGTAPCGGSSAACCGVLGPDIVNAARRARSPPCPADLAPAPHGGPAGPPGPSRSAHMIRALARRYGTRARAR